MERPAAGRKMVLVAGVGVLAVLLLGGVYWRGFAIQYYVYKLRADPRFFLEALEKPREGLLAAALENFLGLREGKECLFRAFTKEVLEPEGGTSYWWLEHSRPERDRKIFGPRGEVKSLEDYGMALLWIGPKTAGFMPAREIVRRHILLKASPGDRDVVASACWGPEGDSVSLYKALGRALGLLRGQEFVHPEHPSLRFKFLAGDEAVRALGVSWKEEPPDAAQTACLVYHPMDSKPVSEK